MKIHVVKIGGHIINNEKLLNSSLESFCTTLIGDKILVHGGGEKVDYLSDKMGVPKRIVEGRRITNKETLDIVVMTYAGIINKNIVAKLQSYQCNALGFSGADGNCIQSFLRKDNNIDYGYVGDITDKSINTDLIRFLLKIDIIPVFCSITHDGRGTLLNTNADTIAAYIAISLSKYYKEVELHFCFEKKGVLRNIKDSESFYRKINFSLFQKIKKDHTIINHGMIPKLENAFLALKNGVTKVNIGHPCHILSNNDLDLNKTVLCL